MSTTSDTRRGTIGRTGRAAGMAVVWAALGYSPAAAQAIGFAHGAAHRGQDQHTAPGQRKRAGRFGLLFPDLSPAPAWDDALLVNLGAVVMRDPAPGARSGDNDVLPAGYTFLGQFIDHDATMDKTPLAGQRADPDALENFRDPTLNLDSVYAPPQPRVGDRLALPLNVNGVVDLPRGDDGVAIIADPRNDENRNLSPLQMGVIRFHNRMVDAGMGFEEARDQTRWHYQWVVLRDFLPRLAGQAEVDRVLELRPGKRAKVSLEFYKPKKDGRAFMPVEWAAAAFRMGHSMVRNNYNNRRGSRVSIFPALVGGSPLTPALVAELDLFFPTPTSPAIEGTGPPAGQGFNVSRKLDALLSPNLLNLPVFTLPNAPEVTNLAVRNLRRGVMLGLPSGQDVAEALGLPSLHNSALGLTDPRWMDAAPLWFYGLKESELVTGGARLGPTFGRLVTEVLVGLLDADRDSILNKADDFTPRVTPEAFDMAAFLRLARAL